MLWYILLAILFFGFMILAHEFGHFITARLFKVGVNEFSIGMGPKLISKRSSRSGTAYSVRALPIGGFVSLVGEDEEVESENALNKKPWWQRFIILFAGSFMNVLLAVSVMFIALSMEPYYASTRIDTAYIENSVLCEYDVQNGDKIVVRPSGTEPKIKIYILAHDECPEKLARKIELYTKDGKQIAEN